MYSLACAGSNSPYDLVFSKADAGPVQLTGARAIEVIYPISAIVLNLSILSTGPCVVFRLRNRKHLEPPFASAVCH
ncbi:hypothetical protein F2P79_001559 [Pimephales promelas]|nr:hypothetical protein F2P79_001559 [Pimephales promelas]